MTGAALMLGIRSASAADNPEVLNLAFGSPESFELTPFVIIEKTGKITLMNPKPDMGQGTFQSIPALIAEELEVSLDQVTIRQTGGEKAYGPSQISGGSYSVRSSYEPLRKVGASAREMLITAASKQWNVPVNECYAEQAQVIHKPSGKRLDYGDLVEEASKLEVPKEPALKNPADFKILGKPALRPDVPLKSTGQAVFGIDVEVPGMVYASVERCPVFGAKLISFDDRAAKKVKGVQQVVKVERLFGIHRSEGVAVIADNYWAALKGRKALTVQWDHQGFGTFSSEEYTKKLHELAKTEGVEDYNQGNFDQAFADAPTQLEAFYETPMVSHSPMEPMNCTVAWQGNKVEVWVSTQAPSWMRGGLAKEFGISEDDVKINVLFNGGGFGRRLYPDVAIEAAHVAKASGKPVKTIWTREDDTQQGPFRPMTFSALKGGLSADGKAVAFQHKVISPSLDASSRANYDKTKSDRTMTEGISEQHYEILNINNRYVFADLHVPVAAWRAVTSTTLAFAHECFLDEMAVKAGKDPMTFRMEMLTAESDTKRVLQKLREVSGWDKPLPAGRGRGVGQWEFFAGLAGNVVEVSKLPGGGVKIEKVWSVIDLGTVVNPDTVRAQVEGAIVMAITAATKNGITFAQGKVEQSNFHDNPVLRISETPVIEVHILAEGGPTIKGVGEPGLPPLAPALANAIFQATGVRIRKMPFDLDRVG